MPQAFNTIRPKPLPPAAGKFGERSTDEKGGARRPAGCPSIEQFEARFLFANDARPHHTA